MPRICFSHTPWPQWIHYGQVYFFSIHVSVCHPRFHASEEMNSLTKVSFILVRNDNRWCSHQKACRTINEGQAHFINRELESSERKKESGLGLYALQRDVKNFCDRIMNSFYKSRWRYIRRPTCNVGRPLRHKYRSQFTNLFCRILHALRSVCSYTARQSQKVHVKRPYIPRV